MFLKFWLKFLLKFQPTSQSKLLPRQKKTLVPIAL